jgi:tetratricopeptide (TPR) repeat protein
VESRLSLRTGKAVIARALLAAIITVLLAARALAQAPVPSEDQRQHFDRGIQLYMAKDYDGAVHELEQACPRDPWRECLFAWAQAERLRGHYASAIMLYDRYLETNPPSEQSSAAKSNRERCEQALSEQARSPSAELPPPPRVPEPRVAVTQLRARDDAGTQAGAPWYRDTTGDAFGVVGIAGLAVGTAFLVASISGQDDLAGSATQLAFEDRLGKLRTDREIAITALSAGAVCAGAAIVHYLWHDHRRAPMRSVE